MSPTFQWLIRWGCLAVMSLAVLLHIVGMSVAHWLKIVARPEGYPGILRFLEQEGVDTGPNSTVTGAVTHAEVNVGLWRWCVEVQILGSKYDACRTPGLGDFPGWWRASQALAVIGLLMGMLSGMCGGMEVYYSRRGVRFSGLAVLCSISCFVTALALGLSNGLYASRYLGKVTTVLDIWQAASSFMYPPSLDWAFGFGAAAATLMGGTGIILLAFITRTYPAYHRTENVVV
ncbi:hypothetical protein BaRGS_00026428 [Batillaria attramentaria]|uniref:Uncharacterized protein n=1 Tax=Batillaria attramentaria TaxID=370345 RepID=A0ABD0K4F6_9CAEN